MTRLPPKPPTAEIAIRDTLWARRAGIVPNPDELVGRRGVRVYEEMVQTDETISACLALLTSGIIGSGWRLEAGAPRDSRSAAAAAELTAQLQALPGTLDSQLADLCTALWAGFALLEKSYLLDGPTVRLKSLRSIHPATCDFISDTNGNPVAVTQRHSGGATQDIPLAKMVHWAPRSTFGSPFGLSLLRPAFRAYKLKEALCQWWGLSMEKLADPAVVAKTPPNIQAGQSELVMNTLSRLQPRTVLLVPGDFDVSLLESSRDFKSTWITSIDRADTMLARAILVPDKSGLSGGQVESGSFALAAQQIDLFMLHLDQLRRSLCACLTDQLLAELCEFQFGPQVKPPVFSLLPLNEDNRLAVAAQWRDLVAAGVVDNTPADEEHVRQLLNFPQQDTSAEFSEPAACSVPRLSASVGIPTRGALHGTGLFSERGGVPPGRSGSPGAPSRPLNRAESRVDLAELSALHEGRELQQVLANGVAAVVDDLKAQATTGPLTAEKIQRLKVSGPVLEKMRRGVEAELRTAYALAKKGAVEELAQAREQPITREPDPDSE